jgi:acetyl-CoA carboxylase biotin carboxyl carrier protein
MMDLDQLKALLELVRDHELTEFEVEQAGLRVRVRREAAMAAAVSPSAAPVVAGGVPAAAAALPSAPTAAQAIDVAEADIELAVVKSPIVGTFYRSPEPAAPAFIEIGSVVKKGQVLCIIEAMKLMNEIDSEYDGEIVNIYVENGQPVQYGERLFAIKTS